MTIRFEARISILYVLYQQSYFIFIEDFIKSKQKVTIPSRKSLEYGTESQRTPKSD